MRWEDLFADLEGQLAAEAAQALRAEVADRSRRAVGRLALLDRLLAHVGAEVSIGVPGHDVVRGRLLDLAAQWLLVEERPGRPVLVPSAGCLWVDGLSRDATVAPEHSLVRRISLVSALRTLAAHRVPVLVQLTDGGAMTGTIDRSYADHVDLAVHELDEHRRPAAVRRVRAVPQQAIAAVRSR